MNINDKVVSVVDIWEKIGPGDWQVPVKGEIYTLREVFYSKPTEYQGAFVQGQWNCRLVEIVNGIIPETGVEPHFSLDGFRPVDYTFGENIAQEVELETEICFLKVQNEQLKFDLQSPNETDI